MADNGRRLIGISTNVGLLLNARQVANEFGYITVPELLDLTQKTLGTMVRLQKYRGHLMNWYDTRTLKPKPPFFISSVDSGNLVASLWTLDQGCLDVLRRPLAAKNLADGLLDHLGALVNLDALSKRALSKFEGSFRDEDWLTPLLNFREYLLGRAGVGALFSETNILRTHGNMRALAASNDGGEKTGDGNRRSRRVLTGNKGQKSINERLGSAGVLVHLRIGWDQLLS